MVILAISAGIIDPFRDVGVVSGESRLPIKFLDDEAEDVGL